MIASADVIEAVNNHAELIKGETLSLDLNAEIGDATSGVEVGENQLVAVAVAKH